MSIIRIAKYVDPERIAFYDGLEKKNILTELCKLSADKVTDFEKFKKSIFDREKIISTGLGMFAAFPHVKISCIPEFFITIGIVPKGVDWDSFDGRPAKIIFMIGGPEGQQNHYLGILSKLSLIIKNETTRTQLLAANNAEEILEIIRKF